MSDFFFQFFSRCGGRIRASRRSGRGLMLPGHEIENADVPLLMISVPGTRTQLPWQDQNRDCLSLWYEPEVFVSCFEEIRLQRRPNGGSCFVLAMQRLFKNAELKSLR